VPARATACGLPLALSVKVTLAVNDPLATGVKVTLMAQLAPAATLVPQLLLCAKSLGFVPPSPMLLTLNAALPVLLKVMVCEELATPTGWFPKLRLVGDRLTTGLVPVPERATACGLPEALSVIAIDAVSALATEGVKITPIAQFAPAATLVPQLLLCAKSLGFVPVSPMLLTLRAALPVLLKVMV